MKKIYLIALLAFLAAGCSKDFLKRYDERIEGTWRLNDIDNRGIGGVNINLMFQVGDHFTFTEGGHLAYTSRDGGNYEGSWDIRKTWMAGQCYYDEYGDYSCNDRRVRSLNVTAVDFISQDVKAMYFDDIVFTGTDRFKAYVYSGSKTYIFRFRR